MFKIYEQWKKKDIDRRTLKWIAAVCMAVDHVTMGFMERVVLPSSGTMIALSSHTLYLVDRFGRAIGRQTFPMMVFFLAEGFFRTRSRWKYLGRLLLGALVSELPFYLLFYTGAIGEQAAVSHNTIWTLILGFLAVWSADVIWGRWLPWRQKAGQVPDEESKIPWTQQLALCIRLAAALAVCAGLYECAEMLHVDYGGMGVAGALLCYCLHGIPGAGPAAMLVLLGCDNGYEWFAFPACILLCFYRGRAYPKRFRESSAGKIQEKGKKERKKTAGQWIRRYVFYLFYPLHLLLIYGLRLLIVGY